MATSRAYVEELLASADIRINGERPWDMQVHDESVFDQALSRGNLGLGESYMAGLWDVAKLDQFFHRLLRSGVQHEVNPARLIFHSLKARMFNLQDSKRAWEVGQHHYDIGNQLYQHMLDPRMVYTCGYWRHSDNLNDAQRDKLELCCQKLGLKPGMRVLDIGCGWGSFMQYAAENYQVECVGVTISKEQVALGQQRCKGLPVEFRLQDYRDLDERASPYHHQPGYVRTCWTKKLRRLHDRRPTLPQRGWVIFTTLHRQECIRYCRRPLD
ncbi:class I SAM-dependent methyltransferase [Idiomarina sp.]|uniref:class I SAM-dependent methyltransferase n=1 Tax=Idiomarina sp. TaxID=1874361 RepID=UPI0025BD7F31|nr:class I SAM-dependent methyltransferase [Idiomarina sp.]